MTVLPVSRRWLVSGRVQGVGFRWFALRQAERLGLGGWAKNLPDGRVEVVAVGEATAVQAFERELERGPTFGRVEYVEKVECPHEVTDPNSFHIK